MNTYIKSLFSFKGELGRLQYFVRSWVAIIVLLIGIMGGTFISNELEGLASILGALLIVVSAGAMLWTALSLTRQRWNDLEWSDWSYYLCAGLIVVGFFCSMAPETEEIGSLLNVVVGIWSFFIWLCKGKHARSLQAAKQATNHVSA